MSPNGKATRNLHNFTPFLPVFEGRVIEQPSRDDFRYSYYTLFSCNVNSYTIERSPLAKHRFLDHDLLSVQSHEEAHDCGYDECH